MKAGLFLTLTLAVGPVFANVITDPYPGSVCSDPSCDVIGVSSPSPTFPTWTVGGARYDVESVSVGSAPGSTVGTTDVIFTMKFNYDNGDATLAPFLNSAGTATLNPGDLLFGLGGSIFFGIPLVNH